MKVRSTARVSVATIAFALAVGSALGVTCTASADSWKLGPISAQPHSEGVSVELPNGEVLVAGGDRTANPMGELLESSAGAFTGAGPMLQERFFAAAALLPGGGVLIAGGDATAGQVTPVPATAEVWSGAKFNATGPMNVSRQVFTLTTLPSGEVLAVGGSPDFGNISGSPTAELYNPATNTWTPTGSMPGGRYGHTATLLPNCRVLLVGDNTTATTYDYVTGTFSPAGSEGSFQRSYQTATLLANGKVLIAGGEDVNAVPLDTASVWDPATGTFTPTANTMSIPHVEGFAARLSDGRVIVGGGNSAGPNTPTNKVDIYDPATNSFSSGASLPVEAVEVGAQTLSDGDVVVTGANAVGDATAIYTPSSLGPTVTPPSQNCSDLTSSGGPGGGTGGPGAPGSGTAPAGTAQHFAILAAKASSKGAITLTLSVPAAGTLTAAATTPSPSRHTHKHVPPLHYGAAHGTAAHLGTVKLTIHASRRAAAVLRSHRSLRVTVKVGFHPQTGAAVTKSVSLTVRRSRSAHHASAPSLLSSSSTLSLRTLL